MRFIYEKLHVRIEGCLTKAENHTFSLPPPPLPSAILLLEKKAFGKKTNNARTQFSVAAIYSEI